MRRDGPPKQPSKRSATRLPAARVARSGPDALLDRIAEGLIGVRALAVAAGDPVTRVLVDRALFHVGRRIARRSRAGPGAP